MALRVVRSFAQRPPHICAFHLNLKPVVPMGQAIAIGGEETLFEFDDRARQLLQGRLLDDYGGNQEHRLRVPFRRDQRAGIAGFIDIAYQHSQSPKNNSGGTLRYRHWTRRLSPARHWLKNCAYYSISPRVIQGGAENFYGQRIKSRFFPFGAPESFLMRWKCLSNQQPYPPSRRRAAKRWLQGCSAAANPSCRGAFQQKRLANKPTNW